MPAACEPPPSKGGGTTRHRRSAPSTSCSRHHPGENPEHALRGRTPRGGRHLPADALTVVARNLPTADEIRRPFPYVGDVRSLTTEGEHATDSCPTDSRRDGNRPRPGVGPPLQPGGPEGVSGSGVRVVRGAEGCSAFRRWPSSWRTRSRSFPATCSCSGWAWSKWCWAPP